jgi:uroporphyrin-III C-methyltransferase
MSRTDDDRRFPYYPAFLDLRRKRVVVVGAGVIATGKIRGLLPCGPEPLIVVAPDASKFVERAAREQRLTWLRRRYLDGDLSDADVCFAATSDRALNARVAEEARRRRIPILAVDDIPNCDFIAPSIVTRGDLIVAMSTGGRSPAFARWVRERFDRDIPRHWGDLLDVVATARERLGSNRASVTPEQWLAAIDDSLERQVQDGDKDGALLLLLQRLIPGNTDVLTDSGSIDEPQQADQSRTDLSLLPLGEDWGEGHSPVYPVVGDVGDREPGTPLTLPLSQRERESERASASQRASVGLVSLVGAGPGDPVLLTLKGLRRLQEADAVVFDRLVSAKILGYCRPGVERYAVGKAAGHHSRPQEEINALLIGLAREGRRVVRLKGGDPFVFGRGGEEVLALAQAGISYEVIPGVSSALAAPAAAGIPVTHRGIASSVTIATGHARVSGGGDEHDWSALAKVRGTLVFLMAVENLEHIVANLLANGRPADESAAMVQSGTTPDQRTVRGSLGEIVSVARSGGIVAPAVLVVGETVALAEALETKEWETILHSSPLPRTTGEVLPSPESTVTAGHVVR